MPTRCDNFQWCEGWTPLPEGGLCRLCWARVVASYDFDRKNYSRYVAATESEVMLVDEAIGWIAGGMW